MHNNSIDISICDIDECLQQNDCDFNAQCINNNGSYSCECNYGYKNVPESIPGTKCTDIDECDTPAESCPLKMDCTNEIGGYFCTCNTGYTHEIDTSCSNRNCRNYTSCFDIDECDEDNGGCQQICENTPGTYK